MKTILFVILSFFSFISFNSKMEDYSEKVDNAYESYEIVEAKENDYYSLIVVTGVCNNKSSFGFFLRSVHANDYTVKVYIDGKAYKVKEDERGDYEVVASKLTKEVKIVVCFSDDYAHIEEEYTLKPINGDTFHATNVGKNEGCDFEKFSRIITISVTYYHTMYIILLLILEVYFIYCIKKGFTKSTQNFIKENADLFVTPVQAPSYKEEPEDTELDEIVNSIKIEDDTIDVIEDSYIIGKDEIEETDNSHVKDLLRDKGFITTYEALSDSEKNEIMLELMMLKNNSLINDDEYQYEVVKLWRK